MTPTTPRDSTMKALLAVIIVLGFFAVLAALFFAKELGESVKDVLLVMLGALIAAFKEITGFFFGSSSGSAAKSATLEQHLSGSGMGQLESNPVPKGDEHADLVR